MLSVLAVAGSAVWLIILLLPWRPWLTRERLEANPTKTLSRAAESRLTVLIPARNEAGHIVSTLDSLAVQSTRLRVIVIDDQSSDATAERLAQYADPRITLTVVSGSELPAEWSGKLWALQQGLRQVESEWVLQLDADIQLQAGALAALLDHAERHALDSVSLMARLRMESGWERLLMPAFVYFFRLLYPFGLVNRHGRIAGLLVAGAAGGCLLARTGALRACGAYQAIRGELIDDCRLARLLKRHGYRIWLGLSHMAVSRRAYDGLDDIGAMVRRTAFHQLRYSFALLIAVTLLMLLAAWAPVAGIALGSRVAAVAGSGLLAMLLGYWPLLRYYRLNPAWALSLPLVASLYLLFTWQSAIRYYAGHGSTWKARRYGQHENG